MKIFVTSDTHFNHKNIIKYCNRPFESVEHMNEALIQNWNETVGVNDFVYHLGDFAFSKNPENINEIAARLNGNIFLIEGNHDHLIGHRPDSRLNFVGIAEYVVIKDILLTHYPVHMKEYRSNKTCKMVVPKLLYGHVHDKPVDTEFAKCVCTELTNYKPVELGFYIGLFNNS